MGTGKRGSVGYGDRTVVARIHGGESEHDPGQALDEKTPAEAQSVERITVILTSHRVRLQDPDNDAASQKLLLDGLRYAGLIPEDHAGAICLKIQDQVKVGAKREEGTHVRILYPAHEKGLVTFEELYPEK